MGHAGHGLMRHVRVRHHLLRPHHLGGINIMGHAGHGLMRHVRVRHHLLRPHHLGGVLTSWGMLDMV